VVVCAYAKSMRKMVGASGWIDNPGKIKTITFYEF
jgi:hypothetical protein